MCRDSFRVDKFGVWFYIIFVPFRINFVRSALQRFLYTKFVRKDFFNRVIYRKAFFKAIVYTELGISDKDSNW